MIQWDMPPSLSTRPIDTAMMPSKTVRRGIIASWFMLHNVVAFLGMHAATTTRLAINSPQLLQLSGVGPQALLNQFNIPVVHHLPGVGENMRDHYGVRMTARVKNVETINERSHGFNLLKEIAKSSLPNIRENFLIIRNTLAMKVDPLTLMTIKYPRMEPKAIKIRGVIQA